MSLLIISSFTKTITLVLSSSVISAIVTALIAKWLGKKKDEIEIALKWDAFYKEQITGLKDIIKDNNDRSEKKMTDMQNTIEDLKQSVKKLIEQHKYKDNIIKEKEKNRLMWENESLKLKDTVNQKITIISDLQEENEKKDEVIDYQSKEINQLKKNP